MRPSRSRGRATSGCATSAASGLPTSAPTATRSLPGLARDREVVDVEHAQLDLAAASRASASPAPSPACGSAPRRRPGRSARGPGSATKSSAIVTGVAAPAASSARRSRAATSQHGEQRGEAFHAAHDRSLSRRAHRSRSAATAPTSPRARATCASTRRRDRAGGIAGLDPPLHFLEGPREEVARYVLILDAINFGSGWFDELGHDHRRAHRAPHRPRPRARPVDARRAAALDAAAVGDDARPRSRAPPDRPLRRGAQPARRVLGMPADARRHRRGPRRRLTPMPFFADPASTSARRSPPTTSTSPASPTSRTSTA